MDAATCKMMRLQRGWYQKDLAERSNLSRPAICNFERGRKTAERAAAMIAAAFRGESLNLPRLHRGGAKAKPIQVPPQPVVTRPIPAKAKKGTLTGQQCRAMRESLGLTCQELAAKALIGVVTLERFEGGSRVHDSVPIILKTVLSGKQSRKFRITCGVPCEIAEMRED